VKTPDFIRIGLCRVTTSLSCLAFSYEVCRRCELNSAIDRFTMRYELRLVFCADYHAEQMHFNLSVLTVSTSRANPKQFILVSATAGRAAVIDNLSPAKGVADALRHVPSAHASHFSVFFSRRSCLSVSCATVSLVSWSASYFHVASICRQGILTLLKGSANRATMAQPRLLCTGLPPDAVTSGPSLILDCRRQ
jgi:hypothetical protein